MLSKKSSDLPEANREACPRPWRGKVRRVQGPFGNRAGDDPHRLHARSARGLAAREDDARRGRRRPGVRRSRGECDVSQARGDTGHSHGGGHVMGAARCASPYRRDRCGRHRGGDATGGVEVGRPGDCAGRPPPELPACRRQRRVSGREGTTCSCVANLRREPRAVYGTRTRAVRTLTGSRARVIPGRVDRGVWPQIGMGGIVFEESRLKRQGADCRHFQGGTLHHEVRIPESGAQAA